MVLSERELHFEFNGCSDVLRFDQDKIDLPDYHDIEMMPRVDFIVEAEDEIYLIEVKDPSGSNNQDIGNVKFNQKIVNGKLANSLGDKFWYSFAFRWAEKKLNKPINYVCLITLETPELIPIQSQLDEKLKLLTYKKSSRWERDPLKSCIVLNIETWNFIFPNWKVKRIITPISEEVV